MKRLKLLKVSIIENKLKTITTTHLSTVNSEVRKSTINYLMKKTLLLIVTLLLTSNVFGYTTVELTDKVESYCESVNWEDSNIFHFQQLMAIIEKPVIKRAIRCNGDI